ncbi:TonB-dependent receptor plug domain-containing protein, partial [Pseudoalteromonas sp. TB51]
MTLKNTLALPLIAVAPFYTLANANNDIETIVVTASGFEQTLAQAPASITLISKKQLENRAYKDLTDALNDVAGVTVTGGGSRQDISVRGMPAQYTAILVDGKKQSGRESQPSGSG